MKLMTVNVVRFIKILPHSKEKLELDIGNNIKNLLLYHQASEEGTLSLSILCICLEGKYLS